MTKVNQENMKKQYEDLWNTFCKKNHDYGSSFEQSLDKYGRQYLIVGRGAAKSPLRALLTHSED